MVRRRIDPDNKYLMDPSLMPIYLREQMERDKAEQLEALTEPDVAPIEVDEKGDGKPKRDPVMAIHLTLQERYEKEVSLIG